MTPMKTKNIVNENKIVTEKSNAKINLTLDIIGLLPNGYHDLRMVMHSVGLYDTVSVRKTESGKVELHTSSPLIPTDGSNLACRAAERFFEETAIPNQGILIKIDKSIPVSAGLAGGSSNAAAVLRILNRLYGANRSAEELCRIGLSVGADVPYCIGGGTMLAEGVGETLTPLPAMPSVPVVLAKPNFGISTPEAFRKWDALPRHSHPDTAAMLSALQSQDPVFIAKALGNTLEDVACAEPENPISSIKRAMLQNGALGALMSGSGPTVFGLFPDKKTADSAADALKPLADFIAVTTT